MQGKNNARTGVMGVARKFGFVVIGEFDLDKAVNQPRRVVQNSSD
jgi:hypothetical protein